MIRKHLTRIGFGMLALLMLAGCGGTAADTKTTVKLDPNKPTNIMVWHYYNGAQQAKKKAFMSRRTVRAASIWSST